MGVDVQGGFNVAVTEIFLHFFRLHAAVVQNACRAVTQTVKRNVGKPRFLDDSLEGTVCRVGIDRFFRVAQAREDPFGADGFLSLFQHADNTFGQDDRADTGVGFRIADRDSAPDRDDLTCHAELAFRFIEVLPTQSTDLTFAQSRHTFEVEEIPPPWFILNDFQKLFELFLVIYFAFRAVQCGGPNLRDINLLDSALESAFLTFDGKELYPTKEEKAARIGYSLISNHAFVDGNKRIGMYVLLSFLETNGIKIHPSNEEVVRVGFATAAGEMKYEDILAWILENE